MQYKYSDEEIRIGVILITILIFLLGIGIAVIIFTFSKRQQLYLKEKQLLQQQYQQQILTSQLETQEETLDIISKELHDNIGQLLNSTKLLLGIVQRDQANGVDTMKIAEETLGKAISELRALSKSLNKEWIQQFNLIDNLSNEIDRINICGRFQISFMHPSAIKLDHDKQIILFRVVQEALQNIIKHANASQGKIIIKEENKSLVIHIEDNGIGFKSEMNTKNGIGITNMQNRIQLLNGIINWNTSNNGTTVSIELPLLF